MTLDGLFLRMYTYGLPVYVRIRVIVSIDLCHLIGFTGSDTYLVNIISVSTL